MDLPYRVWMLGILLCSVLSTFGQPPPKPELSLSIHPSHSEGYKAGETFTLRCMAKDFNPKPTALHWSGLSGENKLFLANDSKGNPYGERSIVFTRHDDTKLCFCLMYIGEIRHIVNITFDVIYPPKFDPAVTKNTREVDVGGGIAFSCTVWAKPFPEIMWTSTSKLANLEQKYDDAINYRRKSTIFQANVTLEQAGRYICWASNSVASRGIFRSFKLRVKYPPTKVTLTATPPNTLAGTPVTLRCSVDTSIPRINTFNWTGTCGEGNGRVIEDNGGSYEVKNIVLTSKIDRKTCSCSINYLGTLTLVDAVTYDVTYAPTIIHPPKGSHLIQTEGSNVSLKCTAKSRPQSTITWTTSSDHKLPDATITTTNRTTVESVVTLTNVSRGQSGEYRCTARNGIGVDDMGIYTLDVQYPPDAMIFTGATNTTEGTITSLTCTADRGNPNTAKMEMFGMCGTAAKSKYGMIASVPITREHDQQSCTCTVSHELGTLTKSLTYDVQYSPVITEPRNPSTALSLAEDADVIIGCKANSKPPPNITWTYSPETNNITTYLVAMETIVRGYKTVSKLKLTSARKTDEGVYRCHATNNIGEDPWREFNVSVIIAPILPDESTMNNEDITILVVCSIVLGIALLSIIFLLILFNIRQRKRREKEDALHRSKGFTGAHISNGGPGFVNKAMVFDDESEDDDKTLRYLDTSLFENSRDGYTNFDNDIINAYDESYDTITAIKRGELLQNGTLNTNHDEGYDTIAAIKRGDPFQNGTLKTGSTLKSSIKDTDLNSIGSIEPDYDITDVMADYSFDSNDNQKPSKKSKRAVDNIYSRVRRRSTSTDLSEQSADVSGYLPSNSETVRTDSTVETTMDTSNKTLDRLYSKVLKNKSPRSPRDLIPPPYDNVDDTRTPDVTATGTLELVQHPMGQAAMDDRMYREPTTDLEETRTTDTPGEYPIGHSTPNNDLEQRPVQKGDKIVVSMKF